MPKNKPAHPSYLSESQQQAGNCGLDVPKLEALLKAIEQNLIQRPLSEKYKKIFYLAGMVTIACSAVNKAMT